MGKNQDVVAVFDFDGTLTTKDSFFRFLHFLTGRYVFWHKMILLIPVFLRYSMRKMDNHEAKELVLRMFLQGQEKSKIDEVAKKFTEKVLPTMLRKEAIDKLNWHIENEHKVVVISASPELYIGKWCAQWGILYYAGTQLESKNGTLTGNIEGRNCHGKEKVNRLKKLINFDSPLTIYAYGDTPGDRHLLEIADKPFYRTF